MTEEIFWHEYLDAESEKELKPMRVYLCELREIHEGKTLVWIDTRIFVDHDDGFEGLETVVAWAELPSGYTALKAEKPERLSVYLPIPHKVIWNCSRCGKALSINDNYCSHCGKKISWGETFNGI